MFDREVFELSWGFTPYEISCFGRWLGMHNFPHNIINMLGDDLLLDNRL